MTNHKPVSNHTGSRKPYFDYPDYNSSKAKNQGEVDKNEKCTDGFDGNCVCCIYQFLYLWMGNGV